MAANDQNVPETVPCGLGYYLTEQIGVGGLGKGKGPWKTGVTQGIPVEQPWQNSASCFLAGHAAQGLGNDAVASQGGFATVLLKASRGQQDHRAGAFPYFR